MALPPAFKTDESFLEKIAMGATAARRVAEDLIRSGHEPFELERGATSIKLWKRKMKRLRVPDLLCLRCGHRVESRGKSKLEITMSHSTRNPERGWDAGLDDGDFVALVACTKTGEGPLDWKASDIVQYAGVAALRKAARAKQIKTAKPKGAQEGFEVRITWPARLADVTGTVERVDSECIVVASEPRRRTVRLRARKPYLLAAVEEGENVDPSRILAAVVPIKTSYPCPGGATVRTYFDLERSAAVPDRYTAIKALGRFAEPGARAVLRDRLHDDREHLYVRLEAAAALLRAGDRTAATFFERTLQDEYLEPRLEAIIVLSEVKTAESARLLLAALGDADQLVDVRAGAAWALGVVGEREVLPALIAIFRELELAVKIEAARSLAQLSRRHLADVLPALPVGRAEERPGIAWALGKAGGFSIADLLPALVDDDARQWVAYVIGSQDQGRFQAEVEDLRRRDPEVYFAVTVLWKIFSSWIHGLEEY
jgi:HEAT repeats